MASLELRLLGGFEGRLNSGPAIDLPTKKTRLLLGFLALSNGRAQPREKLASLLWSDRGDEQAHQSLRHALSALRKALAGAETPPLRADRETVGLDPAAVAVDAVDFEELVALGTPEALDRACALYRGDLLEGEMAQGPPAEEWLFYQRERLRDLAMRAFDQLLDHQCQAGATLRAVETAQALLKLNPAHEEAQRALMRLYFEQGRRAAALDQYRHCREVLKRELDVEPAPETERLYREILCRSGRLPGADPVLAGKPRPWRWAVLGSGALILLALSALGAWRIYLDASEPGPAASRARQLPDQPSIAVLPFENLTGDAQRQRLADGITEDIITDLSRYPDLFVIARTSSSAYRGTSKSLARVAEELGVRYVLEGSLQVSANQARVTVQVIDARDGHHVWAERYERPLDDIFALQDEVTRSVAGTLTGYDGRLAEAGREIARRKPPETLTAYDNYLLGVELKHRFTKEASVEAKQRLHRAIELDPGFARAYVGLAWSHLIDVEQGMSADPTESLRGFRDTALKAVALDGTDGEAHALLALVHGLNGDEASALRANQRALELAPNNADVLVNVAWNMLYVAGKDHAAKAVALIQRAMRLNPAYPDWYSHGLGYAQYFAHEFEVATVTLRALHPMTPTIRVYLAASYAQLGRSREAEEIAEVLLQENPKFSARAYAEAVGIINEEALTHFLEGTRKAGLPE